MSKYLRAIYNIAHWYECQKRVLPWRENPSVYRVWVSEIMLQQTQVATVLPYFNRFIKKFPTLKSLALATSDEVLLYWSGLGYYSRARNLHKGAKLIAALGQIPKTREKWLEIPGVGPYTAGAIASIALNQPEPILDGNVERVLSRVRKIGKNQGDIYYKKRLWRLSQSIVEQAHQMSILPSVINQALMELGATLCLPKSPHCPECPVSKICKAYHEQAVADFPSPRVRTAMVTVRENLHCILDPQRRVLLRKREKGEWRAGLWDLLEQKPVRADLLGVVKTKHVVTHHKIFRTTEVWKVKRLNAEKNLKWFDLSSNHYPAGSALRKTLTEVRKKISSK